MKKLTLRKIKALSIATLVVALSAGCSLLIVPSTSPTATQSPTPTNPPAGEALFVALGDYGSGDSNQQLVAESVALQNPDWFVSLGDNVYSQDGYQALVGDYYGNFLNQSRFLVATGNHDYLEGISNYDSYFGTTEQTRYYKVSIDPDVDIFILDSQAALDSVEAMNKQKQWLRNQATLSAAKFKFVVVHHPPFSAGAKHGSTPEFQWDFASLGITAVLSGHEHLYERLNVDGVSYLVSGVGGKDLYSCGKQISDSDICIEDSFGALYFTKQEDSLLGQFISSKGEILDSFKIF